MTKLNSEYAITSINSGIILDSVRTMHNYDENNFKTVNINGKEHTIIADVGISRKDDFLVGKEDIIINMLDGDKITRCVDNYDENNFKTVNINGKEHTIIADVGISRKDDFLVGKEDIIINISDGDKITRCVGKKVNGKFVVYCQDITDSKTNIGNIPLIKESYLKDPMTLDKGFVKKY